MYDVRENVKDADFMTVTYCVYDFAVSFRVFILIRQRTHGRN